jgi:hypothetical protein
MRTRDGSAGRNIRHVDGYSKGMTCLAHLRKTLTRFGISLALISCVGSVALLALPTALVAQQPAQRVVQGKVVDKSDAGLKGATVYLKDGHTLSVKSYIASDDGTFRFGQLAQNTDYQLWAEHTGRKSSVKNISSFDTRNEFNITLKIDK